MALLFKYKLGQNEFMEYINFPKNDPKNLKDFCPESVIVHETEILQIFWVIFQKIDDFIDPF